jgi:hypothetical protein
MQTPAAETVLDPADFPIAVQSVEVQGDRMIVDVALTLNHPAEFVKFKFVREGDADFFIPQRVQPLINRPTSDSEQDDIEYFQSKLFAALKTPEEYQAAPRCVICKCITKRDKRFERCYSCEASS